MFGLVRLYPECLMYAASGCRALNLKCGAWGPFPPSLEERSTGKRARCSGKCSGPTLPRSKQRVGLVLVRVRQKGVGRGVGEDTVPPHAAGTSPFADGCAETQGGSSGGGGPACP